MTPEQVTAVRGSFDRLWPISGKVADQFYLRLFDLAPDARGLFRHDLERQKTKLISMVATIVGAADRPKLFASIVEDLGRLHAVFGVEASHYPAVREALMWSLQQGLGASLTPSARDAWSALYQSVQDAMLKGARDAAHKNPR